VKFTGGGCNDRRVEHIRNPKRQMVKNNVRKTKEGNERIEWKKQSIGKYTT